MRVFRKPGSSAHLADRRAGAVDPVDVCVGIVLAIVIPLLSFVLVRAFGVETRSDAADFREEPELTDLPIGRDEVEMRWETARRIYETNARAFMKAAETIEDGVLKEHHRRWATSCLRTADSVFEELTKLASDPNFSQRATEAAAMRQRIQADLEKLGSMDVLGLDERRRGLSEQEIQDAGAAAE